MGLIAGSAVVDITPKTPQFLFGYPAPERYSTGVHDSLLSSALYLADGQAGLMFIANDIGEISKEIAARTRARIAELTSLPFDHIMVTATHTHSAPLVDERISFLAMGDEVKADPDYVRQLEAGIVAAAQRAYRSAQPARIGLAVADGTGVGTNRHDPSGPSDPQVPVLMVQTADGRRNLACMVVYSMHPTVLHEDSTLVSGDFPAFTRRYLQANVVGEGCPVLYHMGPAGNQSTRHVVTANTFAEARRLGEMLGQAIAKVIPDVSYTEEVSLCCLRREVDLPRRRLPSPEEARAQLERSRRVMLDLELSKAPRATLRTAECDLIGAEAALRIARAAAEGRLEEVYRLTLPAEIQVFGIGPWTFVGWQGEVFVEFALEVKARHPDTFVISLANGDLGGYVVTPESARQGCYEAFNTLLDPQAGRLLVQETLDMLAAMG